MNKELRIEDNKHFFENIEGWSSYRDQGKLLESILERMPKTDNKLNIAEIGVYKGRCTAMWNIILINSGIKYNYDAIDNFIGSKEHIKNIDYYSEALSNLSCIINKINLIKNDSVAQSKTYPDEYFDIVYIDASHEYEDVKADILSWFPKVKVGGFFCGDDFIHSWPGVKRAVKENFGNTIEKIGRQQWLKIK